MKLSTMKVMSATLLICILQSPASAQKSDWKKYMDSGTVCDSENLGIRLYGLYQGKQDAPDADHDVRSEESRSFVFQISWEGPGQPRPTYGSFSLFGRVTADEAEMLDLAVSTRVSICGKAIPADPDVGDTDWSVAESSKKTFRQLIAQGRTAKTEFLDQNKRVILTRTFDLVKARQAASNLQNMQWRCP